MKRLQDELLEAIRDSRTLEELVKHSTLMAMAQLEPLVRERLEGEIAAAKRRIAASSIEGAPAAIVAPELRQPFRSVPPGGPQPAPPATWPPSKQELERAVGDLARAVPAGELSVEDASKLSGVPPGLLLLFAGADGVRRPYITKDGLQILVERKGKRAVETTSARDPDRPDGWISEAKIWPELATRDYALLDRLVSLGDKDLVLQTFRELTRPTIAHATANPDNVRMSTLRGRLLEMSETRAFCRAARIYTGLGVPSIEEEGE